MHESNHRHVVAWDGVAYKNTCVGNMTARFDGGFVRTLNKVRYVPQMGKNLIFVGELEHNRFHWCT